MTLLERLEALAVGGAFALLRAFPPERAARLAAAIAGGMGPLLPVSRTADTNLRLCLPELDRPARQRLIRAMWRNLGCTVGELPHLPALGPTESGPGFEMQGADILRALARQGGPGIFFSGHIDNWELLAPSAAHYGLRMALLYRAAANPGVDAMIRRIRRDSMGGEVVLLPKGAEGARGALAHLSSGGFLGILADQKLDDGIEVPLFGRPAMTAPALAAFALRFRCPVIPAHAERIGPARLRVIVEPPLVLPENGNREVDIAALTGAVNACIERWVRARPEGWLWLHRRFSREEYR
ncbi:MAG TPA: lauroyl acyltransferase [Acetobacteraceae bacterium]|nr:lauroyl acyltransferase [Acetobacteraceae bacterium]